ncbi:hypothetical protein ADUPG1_001389, partial [Aduncisulcus paluster]
MFGHVGLSAVVANAAPEALPAADLHIPACDEYGVARLLDALVDSAQNGCCTDTFNKWSADLTKALTTERPFQEIELFYGTDRKASGSTVPAKTFGDTKGRLSWGGCTVAVPYDKEIKELKKSRFTMTSYGLSATSSYEVTD